jgi:hypothetical protein
MLKENADCQTIAGDRDQWRLRLLEVAIEKRVAGAAIESFNLGVRRPEVIQRVQDAQVATLNRLPMWLTIKLQLLRYLLIRNVRSGMHWYSLRKTRLSEKGTNIDIAETTSVPVGGEAKPKFDDANLSDDVRKEANAIAERLVSRIKRREQ